jgi:hypothetical protein
MTQALQLTGANLKTTLQGLGLPPEWFAQHCGVTKRSVFRWFDSPTLEHVELPVAEKLDALIAQANSFVDMLWGAAVAAGEPYTLKTFRTDKEFAPVAERLGVPNVASWHRALVVQARDRLRESGHEPVIEYN